VLSCLLESAPKKAFVARPFSCKIYPVGSPASVPSKSTSSSSLSVEGVRGTNGYGMLGSCSDDRRASISAMTDSWNCRTDSKGASISAMTDSWNCRKGSAIFCMFRCHATEALPIAESTSRNATGGSNSSSAIACFDTFLFKYF